MTDRRLELEDFLPYLINRVGAALVIRFVADALVKHGLSIAMWRVLAALSTNGEQRQIDLAEMTSIDASTLSRLVARLVRMGIVTRSRSKTSSREVVVRLTARGRALVERLIPIAQALEQAATAQVPAKDLAALKRCLRLIYKNLARPLARRAGRGALTADAGRRHDSASAPARAAGRPASRRRSRRGFDSPTLRRSGAAIRPLPRN